MSTWLIADHILWMMFCVCMIVSLAYIWRWWCSPAIVIELNNSDAFVIMSAYSPFFSRKSNIAGTFTESDNRRNLSFEQYGNLCLYASYERQPIPNSTFFKKRFSICFLPKRIRLLIPRDSLNSKQYRQLQSFAARQVRLKKSPIYRR
ncbi:hypothetical protein O1D97_03995 [Marinomonas sp. 15G1-11]|uniref:Toxin CptA n=1 Tax=Marinomonas phaeophyticola TaxID=3004091 RepID=A0ABT4JT96_9GAMM|nr:hypothetical protein [Marinomonas sp. 15G1-11]MCZ2720824.1 hypothetical protein [Marinomonas sp. 15G1-11]